jgi:hypothetical protein
MPDNERSVPTRRRELQPEDVVVWQEATASALHRELSKLNFSLVERIDYVLRHRETRGALRYLKAPARSVLHVLGKFYKGEPFTMPHDELAAQANVPKRSLPRIFRQLAEGTVPLVEYRPGKQGTSSRFSLIRDPLSYAAKNSRIVVQPEDWDEPRQPLGDWLRAQQNAVQQKSLSSLTPTAQKQPQSLSSLTPRVQVPTSGLTLTDQKQPEGVSSLTRCVQVPTSGATPQDQKQPQSLSSLTPRVQVPTSGAKNAASAFPKPVITEAPSKDLVALAAKNVRAAGCPRLPGHAPNGGRDAGECQTLLAIAMQRSIQESGGMPFRVAAG